MPWLPLGRGSQFFSAFREPRPRDSVCFAGRASRPPTPHPLKSVPSNPGANNTGVRYTCACAAWASPFPGLRPEGPGRTGQDRRGSYRRGFN
jgi:hypothetical protein